MAETVRYTGGSSPRMRGAHPALEAQWRDRRIIPAYAGSTPSERMSTPNSWDHPRVCGEHPVVQAACRDGSGSSPRMRGAPDHPRVCGEHLAPRWRRCGSTGSSPRMRGALLTSARSSILARIIPAYAGSTEHSLADALQIRDHPRVCGEHLSSLRHRQSLPGSSPRMRGAPAMNCAGCGKDGIIPAYAGSTTETIRPA